jgi:hypothetical protein
MTTIRATPSDPGLWRQVQRIVYPRRSPSDHPPFARSDASPKRKVASWLYYTLLDDSGLRAKVLG